MRRLVHTVVFHPAFLFATLMLFGPLDGCPLR